MDPRRIRGYAVLPTHVRLSKRSIDHRDDSDGPVGLAYGFEWKADRHRRCGRRNEDLDVAGVAAKFDVPFHGRGGRIYRGEGLLAEHSRDLLRSQGSVRPARH